MAETRSKRKVSSSTHLATIKSKSSNEEIRWPGKENLVKLNGTTLADEHGNGTEEPASNLHHDPNSGKVKRNTRSKKKATNTATRELSGPPVSAEGWNDGNLDESAPTNFAAFLPVTEPKRRKRKEVEEDPERPPVHNKKSKAPNKRVTRSSSRALRPIDIESAATKTSKKTKSKSKKRTGSRRKVRTVVSAPQSDSLLFESVPSSNVEETMTSLPVSSSAPICTLPDVSIMFNSDLNHLESQDSLNPSSVPPSSLTSVSQMESERIRVFDDFSNTDSSEDQLHCDEALTLSQKTPPATPGNPMFGFCFLAREDELLREKELQGSSEDARQAMIKPTSSVRTTLPAAPTTITARRNSTGQNLRRAQRKLREQGDAAFSGYDHEVAKQFGFENLLFESVLSAGQASLVRIINEHIRFLEDDINKTQDLLSKSPSDLLRLRISLSSAKVEQLRNKMEAMCTPLPKLTLPFPSCVTNLPFQDNATSTVSIVSAFSRAQLAAVCDTASFGVDDVLHFADNKSKPHAKPCRLLKGAPKFTPLFRTASVLSRDRAHVIASLSVTVFEFLQPQEVLRVRRVCCEWDRTLRVQQQFLQYCIKEIKATTVLATYRDRESKYPVGAFMDNQPQVNSKMRAILVDWMADVNLDFNHSEETLFLSVRLIDRFLQAIAVPRVELQLAGCGAILVAAKMEEIYPPLVDTLVFLCDNTYTRAQILEMETVVLSKLDYALLLPTVYHFLQYFIETFEFERELSLQMMYIAEVTLESYELAIITPSIVATTIVCLVLYTHDRCYDAVLKRSVYCLYDLLPAFAVIRDIFNSRARIDESGAIMSGLMRGIVEKYYTDERMWMPLVGIRWEWEKILLVAERDHNLVLEEVGSPTCSCDAIRCTAARAKKAKSRRVTHLTLAGSHAHAGGSGSDPASSSSPRPTTSPTALVISHEDQIFLEEQSPG